MTVDGVVLQFVEAARTVEVEIEPKRGNAGMTLRFCNTCHEMMPQWKDKKFYICSCCLGLTVIEEAECLG